MSGVEAAIVVVIRYLATAEPRTCRPSANRVTFLRCVIYTLHATRRALDKGPSSNSDDSNLARPDAQLSRPPLHDRRRVDHPLDRKLLSDSKDVEVQLGRGHPGVAREILTVDPAARGVRKPRFRVLEAPASEREEEVIVGALSDLDAATIAKGLNAHVLLVERHLKVSSRLRNCSSVEKTPPRTVLCVVSAQQKRHMRPAHVNTTK